MRKLLRTIVNLSNGVVLSENYTLNGRLHRDPAVGPASISRHEASGVITWEYYKLKGLFHREDGPAEISFNAECNPINEIYWQNNIVHRDTKDGPAKIEHVYENGYWGGREILTIETYCVFGSEYRDPVEGPYFIVRDLLNGEANEKFSLNCDVPPSRPKRLRNLVQRPKRAEH